MAFMTNVLELKPGLVLFHRTDVKHRNWYCRVKIPEQDRYKIVSLRTPDLEEARHRAIHHQKDVDFRVRYQVPIFEKSFAEVAKEYLAHQKQSATAGQLTHGRWKIVGSYIRLHLIPYLGNARIASVGEEKWKSYSIWRKQNGNSVDGKGARDGTIRQEMITLRAIMNFAVSKGYIPQSRVPRGRLPLDRGRREAFTPKEYRLLIKSAPHWIEKALGLHSRWNRLMAYNFMLVMTNTGMRTIEARNLRWRDIELRTDQNGRKFVCLNVRGKNKHRELVATPKVATYLDRIRELGPKSIVASKGDYVFVNRNGSRATRLYQKVIESLLTETNLLYSASGGRRSTYSFRHTYATFRLRSGVDVFHLAKQMGTSVRMIEEYYGHVTPSDEAGRILQGLPGWQSVP